MAYALIKSSFAGGELSPSMFGQVSQEKFHVGASVMRNTFVNYRGPASSRAGTAIVGKCLQAATASSIPPKLIRFQFNLFQNYILEFGDGYMRVATNGGYVTEAPVAVTAITKANPCQVTAPGHNFANGDWVFATGIGGMIELNSRTFIVDNATINTFTLRDIFGDPVNSQDFDTYTSGGSFARIYTNTDSPYAAEDLPYLKYTQDADVMTLTCRNQQTGEEYPPYDLERLAANSWQFVQQDFETSIDPPASCTAIATNTTMTNPTHYGFCVTAVDADTGQESVASAVAYVDDSVNIASVAGSLVVTWDPVPGASYYNVYMAQPAYDTPVPVGSSFGFIGSSFGNEFVNSNIIPDYTKSPPLHQDPFARSQVIGATRTSGGTGYAQSTTTASIASGTGSGAVLRPVVVNGEVSSIIVENGGGDYAPGDTIVIAGAGSGAAFTLELGPATGTYPGVCGYFQQRRVYASTANRPDTYWMTQPGAFRNMDAAVPPIDSDALSGTPWGQQTNALQWLLNMPGGMIACTGLDAWQVSGTSGAGSLITPSQQAAQAQEANGFSPTVPPLKVNFNILFVQSLGSIVRDLQYNFFNNIYSGTDISIYSNHLFDGFEIISWAYAKEPYKLVWATRNDGRFLSLTYLKEEKNQVISWARHDTNGLVVGNEVATEAPVDAPYFIVKRYIPGKQQWAYYLERMDNRAWFGPEDPWCVDCGLALDQPAPEATLSASDADGPGNITGGYIASGGVGYTDPSAIIHDPLGTGSGAEIELFVTDGVITALNINAPGANYSPGTQVNIADATGYGAAIMPFISQNVLFTASSAVFSDTEVDDVIRMGGGQAVVTSILTPTQVVASITAPIKETMPNDPNRLPMPAAPGDWTITRPVSELTNLEHLEGMVVTGLADGAVITPRPVEGGRIELDRPASSIKVGLPFIAQLQGMPTEISGQPTVQGKRKRITRMTIRAEKSRGFQACCDQPVASLLDFQQEVPWKDLETITDRASINMAEMALPLFTGDKTVPIKGDWQNWNGVEPSPGMPGVQQLLPLPMNILALIPEFEFGDTNG